MRILLFVAFMLVSFSGFSQIKWDDIMSNAKKASTEYLEAYMTKDWKQYIALTHNNIITMAGGDEIVIKVAEETISMYSSIGYTPIESVIEEEIQSVDSEAGLQILVPAMIKMKGSGEDSTETSVKLFGLSIDAGETWKFVDLSQYDAESIKIFVPEIDPKIIEIWSSN